MCGLRMLIFTGVLDGLVVVEVDVPLLAHDPDAVDALHAGSP
jgi:hypothetical protein